MVNRISLVTSGDMWLLELDSDPSQGVGFNAPVGSEASVNEGGTGSTWSKYGPLDTDWRNMSDETFNVISLTEQVLPSSPALGLKMFATNVGGRQMLGQVGATGRDFVYQPFLAQEPISFVRPVGNSTTLTNIGCTPSANGTATSRAIAITNIFTMAKRIGYVSAATVGGSCGMYKNTAQEFIGNATNLGGFTFVCRFGISDAVAVSTGRTFVGMTSATSSLANVNPSTLLNILGVGSDSGDTTLSVMFNGSYGTATKVSCGANFPANTIKMDLFEVIVFVKANDTTVYFQVTNLSTDAVFNTSTTLKIPVNTQLLTWQAWRNNGTTALAVGLDIASVYLETDN
jgi:hypothetical protein